MADKNQERLLLDAYGYENQVRGLSPIRRKALRLAVIGLKKKKASNRARTGILFLVALAVLIVMSAVQKVSPIITGGLIVLGFGLGIYIGLILLDIL